METNAPELEVVDLTQQQIALEQEALDLGVARYNARLEREGEAAMPPGVRLIKTIVKGTEGVPGLAQLVAERIAEVEGCKATRGAAVIHKYLRQFTPEEVAYVTVRQALYGMSRLLSVQRVALSIAKALEDSLNIEELAKARPGVYRLYLKAAKKKRDTNSRLILLRKQQEYAGVGVIRWEVQDKLKLGHLLLTILKDECQPQIIDFVTSHDEFGRSGPLVVQPTEWAQNWLKESHLRCSILAPVHMPMVVKPLPWSGPFGGGYLTKALRYPLVKKARAGVLAELKRWHMPKVYAAINALQETEWRINQAVFRVVKELWANGGGIAGLPSQDDLPLPAKNFPEDAPSKDPRVVAWKRKAVKVYDENYRMVTKRLAVMCQLDLAERMSKYERFYFPHALDWRGRAYAVPSHLNPQANDLGRALLQFANGCALGENGAYWLAVHGANCYGVDKVSFEERVQWVQEHEEDILAAALDPFYTIGFWGAAGDPWQFLAFCMEWSGLVMWHRSGKPIAEYVSHLPVSLDGSCNGLQQFSALLRDEVGGKATNLLPSDKPSDIYEAVAKEAQRIIDEKAATGDELALRWVGRINRRITKRNTMTVPYGVTQVGMKDQLYAEFRKMREECVSNGTDPSVWEVTPEECLMLAKVNYEAIGRVVIAARSAMDWLRDVAKVCSQTGQAIRWVAPSGMLVVQDYRELLGKRVKTFMTGTEVKLTLFIEGDRLDKRKMSTGISPNFVHSLDAAHMVSTVVAGMERGLTSFAMIHDSYGTHAGNIDVLAQTLRETFVEQYSENLLEQFREYLAAQLPPELAEKLPPVPPMGNLDITSVLASDYFFA